MSTVNTCDEYGDSPLYLACQEAEEGAISALLEGKADVNFKNSDGKSALGAAVQGRESPIVAMLLMHKADPAQTDMWGISPLEWARSQREMEKEDRGEEEKGEPSVIERLVLAMEESMGASTSQQCSPPSDFAMVGLNKDCFEYPRGVRILRDFHSHPTSEDRSELLVEHDIFVDEPNAPCGGDQGEVTRTRLHLQDLLLSRGVFGDSTVFPVRHALDRALGCMLGLVVGDALGAPWEFAPLNYVKSNRITGMKGFNRWKPVNKFDLKPGQFTDDSSMALCLCDSLLMRSGASAASPLDPLDLRLRFLQWWTFGYNNCFKFDRQKKRRISVGLGQQTSESFTDFLDDETSAVTKSGDEQTSGSGTIMRNAPIAVRYHNSPSLAESMAEVQARTTHKGTEAVECARLLTYLCVRAINYSGGDRDGGRGGGVAPGEVKRAVLGGLSAERPRPDTTSSGDGEGSSFYSSCYSVRCLARSSAERDRRSNEGLDLKERDWRWKRDTKDFRFAPKRSNDKPHYVGSYCMDALRCALHCVWVTDSLEAALLKCVNYGGDADTMCAVTGQLAGAIYGGRAIPCSWLTEVQKWDGGGGVCLRAYLLFKDGEMDRGKSRIK